MDSGDDQQQQGQKNYHRHTPSQIQALEAAFMQCSHPDETQRAELSRDLGLEPHKVKYWFQSRRTQMKVQQERQDYDFLRADLGLEPHKVKYWFQNRRTQKKEYAARPAGQRLPPRGERQDPLREHCPGPCGPPSAEDYYHEQQLRVVNARLKEELAGLTYKPLGRPFTHMPQRTPQMSACRTDGGTRGSNGGTEVVAYEQPQPTAGIHRLAFVVFR
ncbi:hypothetical protein D1007_48338 [Hordeum vulgare]|nr:hypothetical protein D1007_48338 [Hordeum vulgare]